MLFPSRMTADKLDQILFALSALDQKSAINNDQIKQLIDINLKTQASLDEQVRQVSDLLHESINKRFSELSEKLLEDESFRKRSRNLKPTFCKRSKPLSGRTNAPNRPRMSASCGFAG